MKSRANEIRTFDLFCGGGGSSRGATMEGVTIVGGLDLWDVAIDTFSLNFPEAKTFCDSASDVKSSTLKKEIGKIDLLLASPECTHHSIARGNKPRCDVSRDSAFEVIRFAKTLTPRWVVVENVLQMQRWERFEEWLGELHGLGYKTASGILDAQYHSTPQSRKRLFIVADLEATPSLPTPRRKTTKTVSSILGTGEPANRPWQFRPLDTPQRAQATLERANRAVTELGKDEFIMVYYGSDYAGGYQTLDRPLRTVTTLDRFAYVRPNCKGLEMRMLQPPELAAAMGFPTNHKWPSVTRRERIKLIGNAVCPRVMRDVVRALTGSREESGNS